MAARWLCKVGTYSNLMIYMHALDAVLAVFDNIVMYASNVNPFDIMVYKSRPFNFYCFKYHRKIRTNNAAMPS